MLVAEQIDAQRLGGLGALADRQPVVAGAAAQQRVAQQEGADRHRQQNVVKHGRAAAQVDEIVLGIVGNGQKEAGGAADPGPVVEGKTGKFGKGNGEDGEVDAGNAEAKGEKTDQAARGGRDRDRGPQTEPRD